MKSYKPTNHGPHYYTDKRHYVFNRRKSRVPTPKEILDEDDDMEYSACSAYDCTGFIPSAVRDEAQADAYEEIYPYVVPPVPPKDR